MVTVSVWTELRRVLEVLDELAIPYVLGGSLASSLWGVPRSTNDADVMVAPFPGREQELASRFPPDYYLSLPTMKDANLRRRSFNIINTTTGFKTDVFVASSHQLDDSAFRRKTAKAIPGLDGLHVYVLSAEDVVVRKLDWYRQGGESSDRQWLDVVGVLQANLTQLDRDYLQETSRLLRVDDLLERALKEAEPGGE